MTITAQPHPHADMYVIPSLIIHVNGFNPSCAFNGWSCRATFNLSARSAPPESSGSEDLRGTFSSARARFSPPARSREKRARRRHLPAAAARACGCVSAEPTGPPPSARRQKPPSRRRRPLLRHRQTFPDAIERKKPMIELWERSRCITDSDTSPEWPAPRSSANFIVSRKSVICSFSTSGANERTRQENYKSQTSVTRARVSASLLQRCV